MTISVCMHCTSSVVKRMKQLRNMKQCQEIINYLGLDNVPIVGHKLDSTDINMTQKHIESTIQFTQPNSLSELYSFLRLVNCFRDPMPQHSLVPQSFYSMVSEAAKAKQKQILLVLKRENTHSVL